MPKLKLLSDFTIEGTQLIVDGVDLTATQILTRIDFCADKSMDDHMRISYTSMEPQTEPDGDPNGMVERTYKFENGGWMMVDPQKPMVGIGQPDEPMDRRIGGRILEDVSGVSKVNRLILQDGRKK